MKKQVVGLCLLDMLISGVACVSAADSSSPANALWDETGYSHQNRRAVKQDGSQTELFYNGILVGRANCVKGKLEGKQYVYLNGRTSQVLNYTNGERDGVQRTFSHPIGSNVIQSETNYVHGIEEGKTVSYQTGVDGVKHMTADGCYKNGFKDGEQHTYYLLSGKVRSETNYKEGKLDGDSTTYDEQGKVKARCMYKNGVVDTIYVYGKDGTVIGQEKYQDGILVSTTINSKVQYS